VREHLARKVIERLERRPDHPDKAELEGSPEPRSRAETTAQRLAI
jgi:hypothetical protein